MSLSSADLFDCLTLLDDLIQAIYQGSHRFVLLSRVHSPYSLTSSVTSSDPSPHWDVFVGHTDRSRWWRSRWREENVKEALGKGASAALVESFAESVRKAIVEGELYVSGYSDLSAEGNMKIAFNAGGNSPIALSLTEMSEADTRSFLSDELFNLALNAQQRGNRLNPPAFSQPQGNAYPSEPDRSPAKRLRSEPESIVASMDQTTRKKEAQTRATTERKSADTLVLNNRTAHTEGSKSKSPAPGKTLKSAIGKKPARRVQAMEFGDDDE